MKSEQRGSETSTLHLGVAAAWLLVGGSANAVEPIPTPARAMLYAPANASSILVSCEDGGDGRRECTVTQTDVQQSIPPEAAAEAVNLGLREFEQGGGRSWNCENRTNREAFERRGNKGGATTALARKDLDALWDKYSAYCARPTLTTYRALVAHVVGINTRTCIVSSKGYRRSFRFDRDAGVRGAWIGQTDPAGPCGHMHVARLEPDMGVERALFGEYKWKYSERQVVTKPMGGLRSEDCTPTYEWPVARYDSVPPVNQISCDYIVFSEQHVVPPLEIPDKKTGRSGR
jgi:hypothetical protein